MTKSKHTDTHTCSQKPNNKNKSLSKCLLVANKAAGVERKNSSLKKKKWLHHHYEFQSSKNDAANKTKG